MLYTHLPLYISKLSIVANILLHRQLSKSSIPYRSGNGEKNFKQSEDLSKQKIHYLIPELYLKARGYKLLRCLQRKGQQVYTPSNFCVSSTSLISPAPPHPSSPGLSSPAGSTCQRQSSPGFSWPSIGCRL